MSELREYLEFIRPWSDPSYKIVISDFELKDGTGTQKVHRGVDSVDQAERYYLKQMARQRDCWFATQTFGTLASLTADGDVYKGVQRTQNNVQAIHNFWCDLDVKADKPGENYATLQEAVDAVVAFCDSISLPTPSMYVCSGYGLHCYWRIEEDMTLQQWQPIAQALRAAMVKKTLLADHGCTIDSARFLRPPGTINFKDRANPRRTFIVNGTSKQVYPLKWMTDALAPFMSMGPQLVTVGGVRVGSASLNNNLMAGVDESQPVKLRDIATMCPTLQHEFATSGATTVQPLWSLVAMACAFDETPWDTFEELSDGYPNYDEALAHTKLNEKLAAKASGTGWPSCAAFEVHSPACQTCPHWGTIKSPLNLKIAPVVNPVIAQNFPVVQNSNLPKTYYVNTDGTIWTILKGVDGKGVPAQVTSYLVGDGALNQNDDLVFSCKLTLNGPTKHITVPRGTSKVPDITQVLGEQSFLGHLGDEKKLGGWILAWIKHLQDTGAKTIRSHTLGWDEDGGFTHGPYRFYAGGKEDTIYLDQNTAAKYTPKGTIAPWRKLMDFITSCGNPGLEALAASGFASPLVYLIAPDSVMLAPYSKESSAGKTTAIRCAQAVWAHPKLAGFGFDDSAKRIDKGLGDIRHLPVMWDEIRTKAILDAVTTQAFKLGQGKARSVLNAAREVVDGDLFKTMMVAASNYSLAETIIHSTGDSDAGILRVFEIEMEAYSKQSANTSVMAMTNAIENNYGWAGQIYAEYLANNRAQIEIDIKACNDWITDKVKAKAGERFWISTITTLYFGAELANRIGLADFHLPEMLAYLEKTLTNLRVYRDKEIRVITTKATASELISELLNSGEVILTDVIGSPTRPERHAGLQGIDDVKRMRERLAQHAQLTGVLRISEPAFTRWLRERGHPSPKAIKDALIGTYGGISTWGWMGGGLPGFPAYSRVRCIDLDATQFTT